MHSRLYLTLSKYFPIITFGFFLLYLGVNLLVDLVYGNFPSDASVFRYFGWMISEGVPAYTGVWDHKGPVIFWLNALAYSLFPTYSHSPSILFFGLWVATFWMAYSTFVPRLGNRAALGCLLGLFVASANSGGIFQNSVESAALFFSVAAVWNAFVDSKQRVIHHFLVGLFIALSALVKPNLVAAGGALIILWIHDLIKTRDWHTFILKSLCSFIGFSTTLLGVSLYFWIRGSLYDFIDGLLLFNLFEYTKHSGSWYSFWYTYFEHWRLTTPGAWLLPTYLISFLFASIGTIQLYRQKHKQEAIFLGCWSLFEIIIALSAQTFYNHYLILASLPIFLCITFILPHPHSFSRSCGLSHIFLTTCTLGWVSLSVLLFSLCVRSGFRLLYTTHLQRNSLNHWIQENIPQTEVVATWRSHPAVEALCANKLFCPQKYLMQTSHYVYASKPRQEEIKAEFLFALDRATWCFLDISPEELMSLLNIKDDSFRGWEIVYTNRKLRILRKSTSTPAPQVQRIVNGSRIHPSDMPSTNTSDIAIPTQEPVDARVPKE